MTPSFAARLSRLREYTQVVVNAEFGRRLLQPDLLRVLYLLLQGSLLLLTGYAVALAFKVSWVWGLLNLLAMPLLLLAGLGVIRLLMELILVLVQLSQDIARINDLQRPIEGISTMTPYVVDMVRTVSDMSSDLKTIAQMYSSLHKLSEMSDQLVLIANMRHSLLRLSQVADRIEHIADLKEPMQLLSRMDEHFQDIAAMRPTLERLVDLTSNLQDIAEMRQSLDKISDAAEVVSRFRRGGRRD